MGGKKPLRRPLWPPTRATASNYYPLGLDGAGGAAKPLLRAPKKPAPLHGRLPAFSGAVDAFERARKCFLEWRYFFSIILSEFLKNRVALHPRKSTPSISRYAVIFWPAMRTTVGTITFTVCLDRINASMYLFVQLVTGAAKAPTICHPFTRILKRCWLRSILHIWIKSGCCVIIKCTVSPVQIVLYSGPTGKLENVLRLLTVLNPS